MFGTLRLRTLRLLEHRYNATVLYSKLLLIRKSIQAVIVRFTISQVLTLLAFSYMTCYYWWSIIEVLSAEDNDVRNCSRR